METENLSEVTQSPSEDDVSMTEDQTQSTSETDVNEEAGSSDTTEDFKVKYEKLEKDFKSVSGKTSALEKRARELENVAVLMEALNKAAMTDKEFKKLANKKLVEQGLLDPSILEEEEKGDTGSTPPPQTIKDPALDWAREKRNEEILNKAKFFEDFESDKPDITEGSQREVSAKRGAISSAAKVLMMRGVDEKSAFNQAYIQVLHPEKLKEDGVIDGMVKSKAAPSIGGGAGGNVKTSSVNLTDAERKVARAFGISDEEYAEYK